MLVISKHQKGAIFPRGTPADQFIGVAYRKQDGEWCISKRMAKDRKIWIHLHDRHIPKSHKLVALLFGV